MNFEKRPPRSDLPNISVWATIASPVKKTKNLHFLSVTHIDTIQTQTVPPPAPASSEATPSQQTSPKQPSIPTQPAHSLIENDSHYVLAVEVPGFKKNELTLTVTDDTRQLVLSGQNGTRQPIHLKAAIPRLGDLNRLTAVHEDGILTVSIPKLERDGRVVEVTAGNGLEKEDAAYAF
ncbi:hypothetical protein CcCBS67573_g02042 [Chytriomyces confervae]|uniref:SHSP domain-containing protein n=1 Tax=Chytriomyces confervae TaxID=246404 RepID=A0A507FJS7_9FUNG|nr:hypothetical protein CcCBS67573_g02042 [Chytriomyces confervae]